MVPLTEEVAVTQVGGDSRKTFEQTDRMANCDTVGFCMV